MLLETCTWQFDGGLLRVVPIAYPANPGGKPIVCLYANPHGWQELTVCLDGIRDEWLQWVALQEELDPNQRAMAQRNASNLFEFTNRRPWHPAWRPLAIKRHLAAFKRLQSACRLAQQAMGLGEPSKGNGQISPGDWLLIMDQLVGAIRESENAEFVRTNP